MIPKEVIKKIRKIHIKTNHVVNDVFAGEYESAFRGRGMEFEEVREYTPGDDIRDIDWNVTARFGHPFVKVMGKNPFRKIPGADGMLKSFHKIGNQRIGFFKCFFCVK